jgi:hypothetical protein
VRIVSAGTLAGTAILCVAYVVWGLAIRAQMVPPEAELLFLFVPAVAGFVAGWLSPDNRMSSGMLMAVPAAVMAGALNLVLQIAGSDVGFFAGLSGALRAAAFTLLWAGLFASVGGLVAVVARQRGRSR